MGATWASRPRPPGAPESKLPPQTKKMWGTSQARQYTVARQDTEESEGQIQEDHVRKPVAPAQRRCKD